MTGLSLKTCSRCGVRTETMGTRCLCGHPYHREPIDFARAMDLLVRIATERPETLTDEELELLDAFGARVDAAQAAEDGAPVRR